MELPCPICGKPMRKLPKPRKFTCYFCGQAGEGDIVCEAEHFICESCRLANAQEIIEKVGLTAPGSDPIRIADRMMKHPAVPTYGIEHHCISAVAMFKAVRNAKGEKVGKKDIKKLTTLTQKLPYGSCGFMGVCGAAAGVGAAFSVLLGASYMKDRERTLAMEAASRANLAIAKEGGPRCCAASVYTALEEGSKMVKEVFGVDLKPELPLNACEFVAKAEDCRRERCRFYPGGGA
jgi:hypothetical protein